MKKLVNLLIICMLLLVYTPLLSASTLAFIFHLPLETEAHIESIVNQHMSNPTPVPPFLPLFPTPISTHTPMPTPSPTPSSLPEIREPTMPTPMQTVSPVIVSALPVGTEFPITTFEAHQQNPTVSDGIVVWWDGRNDPDPYGNTYNDDIYGYNINTQFEFPIRVIPADQEIPTISGSIVVWQDWRHFGQYDIYGYNLGTQTEFPVSTAPNDQLSPVISGNFVVWTDARNAWFDSECSCWRNTDIYGYNLDTQTEFSVSTAPGDQTNPAISGNIVIWQDNRNGNWDIYGYNLDTHTEFPVRTTSADQMNPVISGSIVVWEENGNIYGYYLDSQYAFPVSEAPGYQGFPAISEYTIVWEDGRGDDFDIYGYDLITQSEFPVSTASGYQRFPAIWKGIVAWQDDRNGNWDIYGYLLPDWGGPPKTPIVLVPGWHGGRDQFDDPTTSDMVAWILDDRGPDQVIEVVEDIRADRKLSENALELIKAIDRAKEKARAKKVIIIGHSMGGLVARTYIESTDLYRGDVERVFMMGTPNGGVEPLPTTLVFGAQGIIDGSWRDLISVAEMLPPSRLLWDLRHKKPDGVQYHLIGGDFTLQSHPALRPFALIPGMTDESNDLIITLSSAHTIYHLFTPPRNVECYTTSDIHGKNDWAKSFGIRSYMWPEHTYTEYVNPNLSGTGSTQHAQNSFSLRDQSVADVPHTPLLSGEISTGETITKAINVEITGRSSFILGWTAGDLNLTLTDPTNTTIDPAYAETNPNIDYSSLELGELFNWETYALTTTLQGTWIAMVQGIDTGPNPEPFAVYAILESGPSLKLATDKEWYQQNETIVITGTLADGLTPVIGAVVEADIARPDNTADRITLYDDGDHNDGAAKDGIYGNSYYETNVGGNYLIVGSATGVWNAADFARGDEVTIAVSPQSASLAGNYSDQAQDIDGDGRYENLTVNVGITVTTASTVTLSASLLSAETDEVDTATETSFLNIGLQTLSLVFDGNAIYRSGVDGPYLLTHVVLVDDSMASVKLDEAHNVHTTQAYHHTEFGTLPPYITLVEPNTGFNNGPVTIMVTGENFLAIPSVEIGDTPCVDVTYIDSTSVTTTVPPGIAAGVYTVTLTNPDGQFAMLPDGFIVTNPPPSPPTGLEVGAFPKAVIRLKWQDNSENEDGFKIERSEGISNISYVEITTVPADTAVYTDTNLVLGESYWYRVRAYNEFGDSDYSNESYNSAFFEVPNFDERYLLVLINEARADPGAFGYPEIAPISPLAYNPLLNYAAHSHSQAILNSGFQFGHCDPAGRCPTERARAVGYEGGVGENLIQGMTGPEWVESSNQAFMDSEGHRNNMLAPDFNEAGLGHTYDPAKGGDSYWKGQYTETFSGRSGVVVPNLPAGIVVPYTGPASSDFTYIVNYYNADGQAPTVAKVHIDGIPYGMTLATGTATNGTYRYTTQLSEVGYHNYYFYFEFPGGSARLPETGVYAGPGVGTPCVLIGDFNGDGQVDVHDIQAVASRWRCKCGDTCYDARYDMDGDCDTDIVDIMLVVVHWGETCG